MKYVAARLLCAASVASSACASAAVDEWLTTSLSDGFLLVHPSPSSFPSCLSPSPPPSCSSASPPPPLLFHAEWLRERCDEADTCVDPSTRQPKLNPHEHAPPALVAASLHGDQLAVTFAGGLAANYSLSSLAAELRHGSSARAPRLTQVREYAAPPLLLWGANLSAPPIERIDEVMNDEDTRLRLLGNLLAGGIALLRGLPTRPGECVRVASTLSTLRATEWGDAFNVRVTPDGGGKRDLAYTGYAIGMHTDNPYREATPEYQLLHAVEQCACEGKAPCDECQVMNHFVDGFYVAELLAREDPEAFKLLASVPVRFENNGGDNTSALWFHVPHFQLRPEFLLEGAPPCLGAACLQAIRFSAKSGGYAPPLPPHTLSRFYAARRRFSEMAHSPELTLSLQLRPGDLVVFDNQRLLHARSAIAPSDGARYVQGCYLHRDGLLLNHERLARRGPRWRRISEASRSDFETMGTEYAAHVEAPLARTMLKMLEAQRGDKLGQPVDLFSHGVQTATRAARAGEGDDLVVAALLHDVTETIQPKAHGESIAAILVPYISPEAYFVLFHHETFQGYYYYHHFGGDRHQRDHLRSSPHWEAAIRWNEYDEASFDPAYPNLPLSAFEPALRRVLSREAFWWNASHPKKRAVTG